MQLLYKIITVYHPGVKCFEFTYQFFDIFIDKNLEKFMETALILNKKVMFQQKLFTEVTWWMQFHRNSGN